ncbi:MAG: nucleotidyltransferase domain-containing protein [Spirochaetaceae bacterium]|nr:MAG: nucleotidyltransferase domain-containing protein [Spirochaetaceae bacterium]
MLTTHATDLESGALITATRDRLRVRHSAHAIMNETMTETIKKVVHDITGAEEIVLFGSRARGDSRSDSDYDILAVVPHPLDPRERLRLSSNCRLHLAKMGIDADVLVKSPDEIRDYCDKRGSIVHEALSSGIPL